MSSPNSVIADLSGLTLQSGSGRLVKDEYTAGISGNGMEMDTGEMVTIQHHATSPRHHHATIPHHHQQFQPTNIIISQGQGKMLLLMSNLFYFFILTRPVFMLLLFLFAMHANLVMHFPVCY